MQPEEAASCCNLCGSENRKPLFEKFGYKLVRCVDCGLEYLWPVPSPEQLNAHYDEGYFTGNPDRRGYLDYVGEQAASVASFEGKLERVERLMEKLGPKTPDPGPRPRRLLDIGAASGTCVQAAMQRGWEATGLEVSGYAVAQAQQRGLPVRQGDSLAPFADQRFDLITMWDVLEHLPDPLGFLRQAHGLLEEGGLLVFSTGDVGCRWSRLQGRQHRAYNPPQHLYYFTRKTMLELSRRAGFDVVRVEADEKTTHLHYVLHIARNLVDIKLLEKMVGWLMVILPDCRVRLKLIDNLVVYLRRTAPVPAACEPVCPEGSAARSR